MACNVLTFINCTTYWGQILIHTYIKNVNLFINCNFNVFLLYFLTGEFLASRGRYKEAAVLYEKAAELKPRDYELAVAAATAMRQASRHDEAERWYRKAVILKPTVRK